MGPPPVYMRNLTSRGVFDRTLEPWCEDHPGVKRTSFCSKFHLKSKERSHFCFKDGIRGDVLDLIKGAGIFGHLSDSFLGRKGSLTIVCILNSIFSILTAFSPNYISYFFLRFLTGFSTGGVGLCAFVLATEPVGPTMRGAAGMSTFYFFSTGIAVLSGIANIFPRWRELYIASSIPSLVFLLFVLPFISESPRWYLVRGRIKEAMNIMSTIATSNGNHLPHRVFLTLDEEPSSCNNNMDDKDAVTGSLVDVIRSPVTRTRLVLATIINLLCSVVYYGLSLNVVNLETNLYLNVILNAVAEMPAFMITAILLDKFGRKPLTIGTLWFSGFFCFVGSLMRNKGVWKGMKMVCGILGIFGMAGTYNLLFIYTAELFPTVVRNAALGCATQAAQMGAILAPVVVVLGGSLPFALFAFCGIAAGVFAFFLPETLNQPLYDTLTGMEAGQKVTSATSSV
ncbi:organic cation/carnitine transporter-like protein [Medicago truncatula]|uniref:Organic cation/carnitine transporter-like protein n=1 Tax=Medicago truncatula TaxID=3880 RepID=A0A072UM32_MEDTR|nr:organic cation/carnitine transporter-like protein [Medicago truncatula]